MNMKNVGIWLALVFALIAGAAVMNKSSKPAGAEEAGKAGGASGTIMRRG